MSSDYLKNKAREISYALIRVSYFVKRPDLRIKLEKQAFDFLENAALASADYKNIHLESLSKTLANIAAMDVLIRMGHALYEIEPVNATILIRELDAFNAAIRKAAEECGNAAKDELPNLESLFSMPPAIVPVKTTSLMVEEGRQGGNDNNGNKKELLKKKAIEKANAAIQQTDDNQVVFGRNSGQVNSEKIEAIADSVMRPLNRISFDEEQELINAAEEEVVDNAATDNAAMRQSAILLLASQKNELRLKDIIAAFPDISERTLRYDLKKLLEQGNLERVGNGGAGSYYRIINRV
ncbi:MAG: DeoR family transcriptional regulator [Candidatus Pacebacteria bacterium]|nr:DeoR family transcriptional regulator [Candidatus Paceibacterota bacterium]